MGYISIYTYRKNACQHNFLNCDQWTVNIYTKCTNFQFLNIWAENHVAAHCQCGFASYVATQKRKVGASLTVFASTVLSCNLTKDGEF